MKKLITLLSLILITATSVTFSAPQQQRYSQARAQQNLAEFASYPPKAKQALHALNQLHEFRELLIEVQKEGPVHLRLEPAPYGANFEGFWDASTRVISVNTKATHSLGQTICTILFELHNASTTRYFRHLIEQAAHGTLDKDAYVEKVEYTEYCNAKHTSDLVEKGIKMDIFPLTARWPIPSTFSEHYKIQQISGHSTWIAQAYNEYNPRGRFMRFRGTVQMPKQMSDQDKDDMMRYVTIRAELESTDESRKKWAKQTLQRELHNARRPDLLKLSFQGNPEFETLTRHS